MELTLLRFLICQIQRRSPPQISTYLGSVYLCEVPQKLQPTLCPLQSLSCAVGTNFTELCSQGNSRLHLDNGE